MIEVDRQLTGIVTPGPTKAETEAYYNRMTEGAERLRNLMKGHSPQRSLGFADLSRHEDISVKLPQAWPLHRPLRLYFLVAIIHRVDVQWSA